MWQWVSGLWVCVCMAEPRTLWDMVTAPCWTLMPLPGMWLLVGSGLRDWMLWCGRWPAPFVSQGSLIDLVGGVGWGGLLRAGWLCSQLVTGWPASSRSTAYCLWESHPLAMGTPSGASILLLLGWMRGCRSDVWPWVLSTLQGLGWESCPGSISICLLLLWGCYCSFPPSLSSQFMTNTHKHLSGD